MKNYLLKSFITGIIIISSGLCTGAEKLSEGTIKKLSELTVLVKGDFQRGVVPAAGFIYKKIGNDIYIVTYTGLFNFSNEVELTFSSGRAEEKNISGKLFCYSTYYNLAVIKVHTPHQELPFLATSKAKLYRTFPLYVAGFSFGEKSSQGPKNPRLEIKPANVSGFNKDLDGSLNIIRLDASVDLGSFGAPVVDGSGKFVGLYLAGLPGTKIAGVLPKPVLDRIFAGNVDEVKTGNLFIKNNSYRLQIKARKCDPLNSVRSISAVVIPGEKRLKRVEGALLEEPIVDPGKFKLLNIKQQIAEGSIELGHVESNKAVFTVQVRYRDLAGKYHYLRPFYYRFNKKNTKSPTSPGNNTFVNDWLYNNKPEGVHPPTLTFADKNKPIIKKKNSDIEIALIKQSKADMKSLFWSSNKKFFFTIDEDNILRKFSFPGCKEKTKLEFKHKISSCSLSQAGIVLVCPQFDEIWVVNEASMQIEKRIKIKNAQNVVCSPELPLAFVTGNSSNERYLSIVDLIKGKLVNMIDGWSYNPLSPKINFNNFSVSENGKYLLTNCRDDFGCFRVAQHFGFGWTASLDKRSGKPLGFGKVVISPDNQYFAIPETGKIFLMGNLNSPLQKIKPDKTLFFDKAHNRIFTAGSRAELRIYNAEKGTCLNSFSLSYGKYNIFPEIMLVDPSRNIIIVKSYGALYRISLFTALPGTPTGKPRWIGSNTPDPLSKLQAVKRTVRFEIKTIKKADTTTKYITPGEDNLVPRIIWSKDKRYIYIAGTKGIVRKISFPGLVQKCVIDLGEPVTDIKLSKSHLVVISKSQIIYTLSPVNLKKTRRSVLTFGIDLKVSLASDLAYSADNWELEVVDLNKLTVVNKISSREMLEKYRKVIKIYPGAGTGDLTPVFTRTILTPDGKYLICGRDHINKFKLVGNTIKYLEVGPPIGEGNSGIYISQDSQQLLITYPTGLPDSFNNVLEAPKKSAMVFKIDDFSRPVSYINVGDEYADKFIFDANRNINYFTTSRKLFSCSKEGFLLKNYNFNLKAVSAIPDSPDLLGIDGKKLCLISFTVDKQPFPSKTQAPKYLKMRYGKPKTTDDNFMQYCIIAGSGGRILDVEWIEKGKAFLILVSGREGIVIRKLTYPDLKDEGWLQLSRWSGQDIVLSQKGALIEVGDRQEAWIIDPVKFTITGKIPLGDFSQLNSSENSNIVFAFMDVHPFALTMAYNLNDRKILYQKDCAQLTKPLAHSKVFPVLNDIHRSFMSSNGKYLICQDSNSLYSFSVDKHGTINPIGAIKKNRNDFMLSISSDSRYMGFKKGKSVEIRKVCEPGKVVLELPMEKASALGFDRKAGKLYVGDSTGNLTVFGPQGNQENVANLTRGKIKKICIHPASKGKMLVLTDSFRLFRVETEH